MVWYESNCMITECFAVEESNCIIKECQCGEGLKLQNIGVMKESNCIIKEC